MSCPMFCSAVRLTGAVFFDVEAQSPFVTESAEHETASPSRVMTGAGHVIGFHIGDRRLVLGRGDWSPLSLQSTSAPARSSLFPAGDAQHHGLSTRNARATSTRGCTIDQPTDCCRSR